MRAILQMHFPHEFIFLFDLRKVIEISQSFAAKLTREKIGKKRTLYVLRVITLEVRGLLSRMRNAVESPEWTEVCSSADR